MKKNILIAIILCVFNSVAAFAQTEKEYSMIISLQNGSTVTLGHNDIKSPSPEIKSMQKVMW